MIFLKPAVKRMPHNDQKRYGGARRSVAYSPASTGTNYNLVEEVEHDRNEKVIWKIMHSPNGDFVYDYAIKSDRRKRRKRCSGCQNFLEPDQRKCLKCQAETRKARNRRYYDLLKTRIKTDSPYAISIDFDMSAIPTPLKNEAS
jgi:hypothetical protein